MLMKNIIQPRSGGSHIKGIMRICHNLVEASNMGVMFGFADKPVSRLITNVIVNHKTYCVFDTF